MKSETITVCCDHQIPAGASILLFDGRLMKVVRSTRHTIDVRGFYWWESAWMSLRYRVRQAWRWVVAWIAARRAARRAKAAGSS